MTDARSEADTLVSLLEARHAAICYSLDGGFPELRDTVWQSEASVQGAVQVRACYGFSVDVFGRRGTPRPACCCSRQSTSYSCG